MFRLIRDLYYGRTNFAIVERRRIFYIFSSVLVVGSLVAVSTLGLELSIDFRGGTSWKVSYGTPGQLEAGGEETSTARALAQRVGAPSESAIREAVSRGGATAEKVVYLGGSQIEVQSAPVDAEVADNVSKELAKLVNVDPSSFQQVVSATSVSPTWGAQISRKALQALIVFLVAVSVYISLRFQWKMAIAALVALAHDIIITIGTYAVTRFTVAPATVIATLTILGYSLYDDVVVFDRVKETSRAVEASKQQYSALVNRSLNQVLMRSLNTSLTSLLPVSALLLTGIFFGVPTLKDFALALFVGILAGTYSSIFVASPLLVTLGKEQVKAVGLSLAKERALASAQAKKSERLRAGPSSARAAPSAPNRASKASNSKSRVLSPDRKSESLADLENGGAFAESEYEGEVERVGGETFQIRSPASGKTKKKNTHRSVPAKSKGKSKAKRKRR